MIMFFVEHANIKCICKPFLCVYDKFRCCGLQSPRMNLIFLFVFVDVVFGFSTGLEESTQWTRAMQGQTLWCRLFLCSNIPQHPKVIIKVALVGFTECIFAQLRFCLCTEVVHAVLHCPLMICLSLQHNGISVACKSLCEFSKLTFIRHYFL